MKYILSFFTILFLSTTGDAQVGGSLAPNGAGTIVPLQTRVVFLRDLFPTAVQPKSRAGIDGSPFIYDSWLLAKIQLADGRYFDSVYIKLNGYENKVHFKDDNGEEMVTSVRVEQITITDQNPLWQGVVFRTGYEGEGAAFFQVLADGKKIQLLKKVFITKWETKALGEEEKRTLQLDQELYFSADNKLYKSNKKCSVLTEIFADKKDAMLQFVSANELRCNKEEDMKKTVDYFNAL